jgi:hypothetical protein
VKKVLCTLLLLAASYAPAKADIVSDTLKCVGNPCVVRNSYGGDPLEFWLAFVVLKLEGRLVVIDGICASSCAWVADLMRHDDPTRVCITDRALFGFHTAQPKWLKDLHPHWRAWVAPRLVPWHYEPIRNWVMEQGGFPTDDGLFMYAEDAKQFWSSCLLQAPLPRRRPPSAPRRTSLI